MVDIMLRPFAINPQPRKAVRQIMALTNFYPSVTPRHFSSSYIANLSYFVRPFPNKNPCLRIIIQDLFEKVLSQISVHKVKISQLISLSSSTSPMAAKLSFFGAHPIRLATNSAMICWSAVPSRILTPCRCRVRIGNPSPASELPTPARRSAGVSKRTGQRPIARSSFLVAAGRSPRSKHPTGQFPTAKP